MKQGSLAGTLSALQLLLQTLNTEYQRFERGEECDELLLFGKRRYDRQGGKRRTTTNNNNNVATNTNDNGRAATFSVKPFISDLRAATAVMDDPTSPENSKQASSFAWWFVRLLVRDRCVPCCSCFVPCRGHLARSTTHSRSSASLSAHCVRMLLVAAAGSTPHP